MTKRHFVTSDIHFSHDNIIKYCHRPFRDSFEMNSSIIDRWNKTVSMNDDVFIVGDLSMTKINDKDAYNKLYGIVNQMNGRKYLIRGNHDYLSDEDYLSMGIDEVYAGYLEFSLYDREWVLCHYQMTSWNRSFKGAFHLFGHEHWRQQVIPNHSIYESMEWSERKYNVCMDANDFTPIDFRYLVKELDKRPTNFKAKGKH